MEFLIGIVVGAVATVVGVFIFAAIKFSDIWR